MDNRGVGHNNAQENTRVSYRTVFLFAICVSAILLISQIEPIREVIKSLVDMLLPVLIGVLLAYIINPFTAIMERWFYNVFKFKNKKRRSKFAVFLSVACSVVALVAAIALLIFLILPEFLDNLYKLIDNAPAFVEKGIAWVSETQSSENVFMQNFGQYVDSLLNTLLTWLGGEFGTAVSGLINSIISVVGFLFDFLISIIIFIYALLEKKKFIAQSKKVLFAVCKPEVANDILNIARYGNEVFGKFISGKLLTSTIVGIVTFTFMSIMGMPYALLSAGIISITNIIPFFGPFIGGIPTAFIVLITNFRQGIIYIIFLLILQQIEGNIIEPMIMEDRTGLSKFWVTFALLLCGGVFGIAGMIFSVPLFAVLFYIIKIYTERSLAKKELPVCSDSYSNAGGIDISTNELLPVPPRTPHMKFSQAIKEWRERVKSRRGEKDNKENDKENDE